MRKFKWISFSTLVIIVFSLNISCNRPKVLLVKKTEQVKVLVANELLSQPEFDITDKIFEISYINLKKCPELTNVDEVKALNSLFYVFDQKQSLLVIFNQKGEYVRKFRNVNSFCLTSKSCLTYNFQSGQINEYTIENELISSKKVGFLGLEMSSNDGQSFYFSTAGINGRINRSSKYELIYTDNNFNFKAFAFNIPKDRIGINYSTGSRFTKTRDGIFYLPLFADEVYSLNNEHIKLKFRFDFGSQSLTDSIFSVIKNSQDFHHFPYVIDLTLIANTTKYSIYSFSYQRKVGYILVNNIEDKVEKYGFNFTASKSTNYEDFTPVGSLNDSFISVFKNKKKSYRTDRHDAIKALTPISQGILPNTDSNIKKDFTLILYKLR